MPINAQLNGLKSHISPVVAHIQYKWVKYKKGMTLYLNWNEIGDTADYINLKQATSKLSNMQVSFSCSIPC